MGANPQAPHAPHDDVPDRAASPHASVRKRALRSPGRATNRTADPPSKVVVPVRYSHWLKGDLGTNLERSLKAALADLDGLRVTPLPTGYLIEARESPGPMLEAVHRATVDLERGFERCYPVFHHQMGPVFAGTLQSVFA